MLEWSEIEFHRDPRGETQATNSAGRVMDDGGIRDAKAHRVDVAVAGARRDRRGRRRAGNCAPARLAGGIGGLRRDADCHGDAHGAIGGGG